jgi:hypothetical protein
VPPVHTSPFHDPLSKEINIYTTRGLDKFGVRVFLCGSSRKPKRAGPGRPRQRDIRAFLKNKLASEVKRCVVRLGEHKEMIRAYSEPTGRRASNLAIHEYALVKDHMDIVIIFPCSPGSFAELGMFCMARPVAEKMRIIINRKYKKNKGYVMLGPVKAATQNNARVVFVDYRNRRNVWREVKDLVLEVKAAKRERRLLRKFGK